MKTRIAAILILSVVAALSQDYPSLEISNGILKAGLHLPDAEKGSYRATRFDWSGILYSLEYKGHQYFGRWYQKHDPLINDAITGPVESFDPDESLWGYADAKPGDLFLRIGVGHAIRTDSRAFSPYTTYKVADPGKWTVTSGKNWVEFQHTVSDRIGYAYVYTKRITLTEGKPEMVISHSLRNTGRKAIRGTQYNHNFFVIDKQPSGPGYRVIFPFQLKALGSFRGMLEAQGNELIFFKEFQGNQSVQSFLEGFGPGAKDYDIRVENRPAGAGVRITSDRPMAKLNFWTRRETVCPEPYVALEAAPGKTERWVYRYVFYTLGERR